MSVLKKLALVMLVALWVPATSHCVLAGLSGMEALECCSQEPTECSPCHEKECASDVCATIEAGNYKTETSRITAPQPEFAPVLFECLALDEQPASSALTAETASPPLDLLPVLHFRTRAVLPARAPTLSC